MARPLVQLPHHSKGTGPRCYRNRSLGPPMGRMPSPISIRQSSGSSISEFRVLLGPHPGTSTPVSIFLLGVLAIHQESRTLPPMHFHWDRASALQLLVPHANPTPSPIPSTLQDLLTPVTGTGGSGPLCPRHRRQHNEDIRLWEATFPHVMQGRRFDTSPLPLTEDVLCLFVAHLMQEHLQFTSIHTYLSTVRHLQITAGIPDPFTPNALPRLSYVLVSLSLPRYSPFSTIHGRAPARHRNPTQPVALDSLASSGWVNSQILSVSTISLKPRMTPQTTCGFPRPTLSVEGFMSIWAERLHSSAQFYFSVL